MLIKVLLRTRDSSVSIVTRGRDGQVKNCGPIVGAGFIMFFSADCKLTVRQTHASVRQAKYAACLSVLKADILTSHNV